MLQILSSRPWTTSGSVLIKPFMKKSRLGYAIFIKAAAVVVVAALAAAVAWQGWNNWRHRTAEPPCEPLPAGVTAGCIASFRLVTVDVWASSSIAVSPEKGILLAAGPFLEEQSRQALIAFSLDDGRELWRLPVDVPKPSVSVSPNGDQVVVWDSPKLARLLNIPDGQSGVDVPIGFTSEITFVENGSAIDFGNRDRRLRYRLADDTQSPAPGFGENRKCVGPVGRSNIGTVTSRDNALTVQVVTQRFALVRHGQIASAQLLAEEILCDSVGFMVLIPPAEADVSEPPIAVFSPNDDRLALSYRTTSTEGRVGTVIEIFDTSQRREIQSQSSERRSADLVASFLLDGPVYNRLGWSQDGRNLAVIRDPEDENGSIDARIYAVP